jgi:hypothetical protein
MCPGNAWIHSPSFCCVFRVVTAIPVSLLLLCHGFFSAPDFNPTNDPFRFQGPCATSPVWQPGSLYNFLVYLHHNSGPTFDAIILRLHLPPFNGSLAKSAFARSLVRLPSSSRYQTGSPGFAMQVTYPDPSRDIRDRNAPSVGDAELPKIQWAPDEPNLLLHCTDSVVLSRSSFYCRFRLAIAVGPKDQTSRARLLASRVLRP